MIHKKGVYYKHSQRKGFRRPKSADRFRLEKYRADTLTFTPTCSVHILECQAESMLRYLRILNLRAKIEHINLSESVFYGKP